MNVTSTNSNFKDHSLLFQERSEFDSFNHNDPETLRPYSRLYRYTSHALIARSKQQIAYRDVSAVSRCGKALTWDSLLACASHCTPCNTVQYSVESLAIAPRSPVPSYARVYRQASSIGPIRIEAYAKPLSYSQRLERTFLAVTFAFLCKLQTSIWQPTHELLRPFSTSQYIIEMNKYTIMHALHAG